MDDIFKGQSKPGPVLGNGDPGSEWWGKRKQFQPGGVPQGGFNPVYRAGKINPQTPSEPTKNFKVFKKPEKKEY